MSLTGSIGNSSVRYGMDVFDLILFFASEKGEKSLPRREKDFVVFLASGLVEYLDGDVRARQLPEKLVIVGTSLTREFNEVIERAFEQKTRGVNMGPVLTETLKHYILVGWEHDHGESWWQSGLRGRLSTFPWSYYSDTFNLDVPMLKRIEDEVISRIDEDTLKHCREIGRLMRKYIDLRNQNNRV